MIVVDMRSRRAWQPDCGALARSRIAAARSGAGLTAEEFAAQLSPMVGRDVTAGLVRAWESTATPPGDILIASDAFSPSGAWLSLRSHKFICGYPGEDDVAEIARRLGATSGEFCGLESRWATVHHPGGDCMLTLWPCGSAVFHLAEDIEVPDVATLAAWRVKTYAENLDWATGLLRDLAGDDSAAASYVLSAYWVSRPAWAGPLLSTGMRLVCSPRVLLEHGAGGEGAAQAERDLLAGGYEHAQMRDFGMRGVSAGYASWSGVSYYPADPNRALDEDELTAFELAMQSVWAFCEHACRGGLVPEGYGYRFLRTARSLLASPRPQESGQYQAMRQAIMGTSDLEGMMAQAIEMLREDGRP